MASRLQVFRCELCGHVLELVHDGQGTLVCCNQPMTLLTENTTDAAQEKHVPVAQRSESKIHVTVGSAAHPMAEDHYIEWIELIAGDRTYTQYLNPGEAPEATFCGGRADDFSVRAYCNLHGLWKS